LDEGICLDPTRLRPTSSQPSTPAQRKPGWITRSLASRRNVSLRRISTKVRAVPPHSAPGPFPFLVSFLVSNPADCASFTAVPSHKSLAVCILQANFSMAWKRSSIRSRPGPPNKAFTINDVYGAEERPQSPVWRHLASNLQAIFFCHSFRLWDARALSL
jgi:hypothetical protein